MKDIYDIPKIAVTGCSSGFAKALLPLLENDPNVEQIVGIDVVAPAATYNKFVFHKMFAIQQSGKHLPDAIHWYTWLSLSGVPIPCLLLKLLASTWEVHRHLEMELIDVHPH